MNLKIKISLKKTFYYIFLLIIIMDCFVLFILYSFMKNNVYEAFSPDPEWIAEQSKISSSDINEKKFNEITEFLEKKEKGNKSDIKNIFN